MNESKYFFSNYEKDIISISNKLKEDKIPNYKTILRLVEIKEIIKEFDLIDDFEKSKAYQIYEKYKLLNVELEFMKKLKDIYQKLDYLVHSRNISKIENWKSYILKQLRDLNMYEEFMESECEFFKHYQFILKDKKSIKPDLSITEDVRKIDMNSYTRDECQKSMMSFFINKK